jgi:hypothetical protein
MNNEKLFIAGIVALMVVIVIIGGLLLNSTAKSNGNIINDINTVNAGLNVPFTLKIDQTADIKSENLKVTFLNVNEDSRCPSDVQCVWEGQAKVQINVLKNNQDIGTFNLTKRAGHDELSVLNVDGHSITLEKVDPYPVSTKKTGTADYSIVLKIKKI